MKRIIIAFLILLSIPLLLRQLQEEGESINQQVSEISHTNSKNFKTANWEYIKARAFAYDGTLLKGYDNPVTLILDNHYSCIDSIIIEDFIKEIQELAPSVEINLSNEEPDTKKYHQINLFFDSEKELNLNYGYQRTEDGTVIQNTPDIRYVDGIILSELNFKFNDTISDSKRKEYIVTELARSIFGSYSTQSTQNSLFPTQIFNSRNNDQDYGLLDKNDKFFLKKVYAEDFKEQFKDYLNEYYPWRYAYRFLNKEKAQLLATGIDALLGVTFFLLLFSVFQRKKFKYSFLNYFIPTLLIIQLAYNLDRIYQYFIEFNSFYNWRIESVFFYIVVPIFALFISVLMWMADKFILKENMNFSYRLALKVTFTFIAFTAPFIIVFLLDDQTHIDTRTQIEYLTAPWLYLWLILAIGRGVLTYLDHLSDSLVKQKDVELSQLQEAKAQSELKLLQSHINPHFLYNALNSIAGLAHDDADKTEEMALSLSDLFRYSLNKKGEKMSTVQEEVRLVENYLDIEQIRFGERLNFTLSVDDTIKNEEIPMFLLQPLVENAVKHGVSKISGAAEINLVIKKEGGHLKIIVQDNGPDFPKGLVSGHGLQTVYDLLRLSYDDQAELSWENSPQKQIVITINQNS